MKNLSPDEFNKLTRAERRRYLRRWKSVKVHTKDGFKSYKRGEIDDAFERHNEIMREEARRKKEYESVARNEKGQTIAEAFEIVG